MPATSARPLRVLVIAEACNPTWTSVPLEGYSFARALAERDDLEVTVVTHVRNRPALAADPLAVRARVHFVDNEWVAKPLYHLSRLLRGGGGLSWTTETALAWPSYIAFEQEVYRRFGRALHDGAFDLVHRVTPLSPTVGSPLAAWVDVPMLLGPINGGLPWPKEYSGLRRREREWLVPLRRLYRALPYYRSTYRHLAGVIAGSKHTAGEIPGFFTGRRFYLPENGVDPARFPLDGEWGPPRGGRFRFISVGRLVPYKGFDLVLEAMRDSAALRDCELVIVGDGPERARLEGLAREWGLSGAVRFAGWVDHRGLAAEYAAAQAFAFPSLREFGGGVVLEALASGLPAVVVDYGGPGELVTPDCGVLLPMRPREELVPALRGAMAQLAADPARCAALSAAARRRVREEFTWPAKAARIVAIYHELLDAKTPAAAPSRHARRTEPAFA